MRRDTLTWRALDACVAVLTLPALLLLFALILSEYNAHEHEPSRSAVENIQTLVLASLLFVVSVFVCCYVAHRLRLGPCTLFVGKHSEPASSKPLSPWQHKSKTYQSISRAPVLNDILIDFELPLETRKLNATASTDDIPAVHSSNKSWAQRASMEQGCYQNLRPQEDNG